MEPSRQQIVGLDVSKAWLGGYAPATGRRFKVSNDPAGIDDLLRSLDAPTGCLMVRWKRRVAMSGPRIRPWRHKALRPRSSIHRVQSARSVRAAAGASGAGGRVRDFTRGMGLEAKTDRVDAKLIARYGEVMRPTATPLPDPARLELREILAIGLRPIPRRPDPPEGCQRS